jgi:hypothetical protein
LVAKHLGGIVDVDVIGVVVVDVVGDGDVIGKSSTLTSL